MPPPSAPSSQARVEGLAIPLVSQEGAGLPTMKEALTDVVARLHDHATVARLNKAIQAWDASCFSTLRTVLNRVVENTGTPLMEVPRFLALGQQRCQVW